MGFGPNIVTTTKIALRGYKGRFRGGLVASRQNLMGSWAYRLNQFISYDITDHIAVEGQVFAIVTTHESYLAWGADVVYRQDSGLFAQVGVAQLHPDVEPIFNLSLGYQFGGAKADNTPRRPPTKPW